MVSKIETLFLEKLSSRFLTVPCFDKFFETILRLKYCKAPPEAKNIPLSLKSKQGRPSKAKKDLLVQ